MLDNSPDISDEIFTRRKSNAAGLKGVKFDIPRRSIALCQATFTALSRPPGPVPG